MIEVDGLTKYYGDIRAISDLTFSIEKGQIAGFLGLNGAGKSTALKVLAGFLLPTAGSVRVDGIDVVAEPEKVRQRIGFLPEEPPLYKEMTVSDFLTYLGKLRGMGSSEVTARLPSVLDRTGLAQHGDRVIDTLSLGYRKRVGIAQAIIHDPSLVILDEPVSGLDPLQRVEMRKLVRGLGGDHTVLISSHNLLEVEETCDLLLMLGEGQLVARGSEDEIHARIGTGASFEIDVRGDANVASARLRALDAVSEASVTRAGGEGDVHEVTVALAGDDKAAAIEAAVADLVGAGFGVSRVEASSNELEDLFLKLAGTQEGEA